MRGLPAPPHETVNAMISYLKKLTAIVLCVSALLALFSCAPSESGAPHDAEGGSASAAPALTKAAVTPAPAEAFTPEPSQTPEPSGTPGPVQTLRPDRTAKPTPTPEPTPTPTPSPAEKYLLYLEKGSYTLTVYERDDEGEYTVAVKSFRVSHGGNRTPAGTFVLYTKQRWHPFAGGDNGYAQYAVMYNPVSDPTGWSGLFIHGPMYREEDPNTLWPRYYDGTKAIGGDNTQGCIRMVVEAAKFIYDNCPKGTVLKIVNGSPKGTTSDPVPSRHGLLHDPTDKGAAPEP